MNDAALLDSLHAALRNPDLAWYTEFHAGESIVAGYLDSLTDGAADVFLEIVMQPFLGFDDIVPDSSSPATV